MSAYSFTVTINKPIDEAIEILTKSLMNNKLGIVSDVRVSDIVKNKLNETMDPCRILGACNPMMAKTMIEDTSAIGALLPCTIFARERDGVTILDFMDPEAILGLENSDAINEVAKQAKEQLLKTIEDIEKS